MYNTMHQAELPREGGKEFIARERFKRDLQVGDVYRMPVGILAIQYDLTYENGLDYTVVKKYPHVVLLERQTPKGISYQSTDYWNLMRRAQLVGRARKE